MRLLYLFLKFLLRITLWIYYPRFKILNKDTKRLERTVYMCNHSASFMDPLVITGLQTSVVFFMTRGDIYKGFLKPTFWAAHMLPIYRQHDKGNTKKKNEEVFKRTNKVLSFGRSLIIFAEGFTDDVFIRRLKPVKKGGVIMGFLALEDMNWEKKVYIQPVGVNYSDPKVLGSDCLVSNGEPVCLNNYRAKYEANPKATIQEITERMEIGMREQITDIRNEEMAPFHENIMRITRKGMNPVDVDKSLPLEDRWNYSRQLANWMNDEKVEDNPEMMQLKDRLENYFADLKENDLEENPMYRVNYKQRKRGWDIIYLATLWPFMLLGHIFTYIPYKLVKNWIEKAFKRDVFWSSVKMLVGAAAVGVYNFILLLVIAKVFGLSFGLLLFLGLVFVPILFVMARNWKNTYVLHKQMEAISKRDVSKWAMERDEIAQEIKRLIPVA